MCGGHINKNLKHVTVNQSLILVGKDKESEEELSNNSLRFYCFCTLNCQSKSHVLNHIEILGNYALQRGHDQIYACVDGLKRLSSKIASTL